MGWSVVKKSETEGCKRYSYVCSGGSTVETKEINPGLPLANLKHSIDIDETMVLFPYLCNIDAPSTWHQVIFHCGTAQFASRVREWINENSGDSAFMGDYLTEYQWIDEIKDPKRYEIPM